MEYLADRRSAIPERDRVRVAHPVPSEVAPRIEDAQYSRARLVERHDASVVEVVHGTRGVLVGIDGWHRRSRRFAGARIPHTNGEFRLPRRGVREVRECERETVVDHRPR